MSLQGQHFPQFFKGQREFDGGVDLGGILNPRPPAQQPDAQPPTPTSLQLKIVTVNHCLSNLNSGLWDQS